MIRIARAGSYPVSHWSGGTTTQLYIYPETAEYAKRNFLFRLSSATVEGERSDFTRLEGVRRILMVLEGALHLTFEGQSETALLPYEQVAFDGGGHTQSRGRATDYNAMMRGGTQAEVISLVLQEGEEKLMPFCPRGEQFLIYCTHGRCSIEGENGEEELTLRDLAVIGGEERVRLIGRRGSHCHLVCCRVWELTQDE